VFFRYWLSFCIYLVSEIINSVWLILNNGTCINEHEGGLTGGSWLLFVGWNCSAGARGKPCQVCQKNTTGSR
jgi:hypothetical protein